VEKRIPYCVFHVGSGLSMESSTTEPGGLYTIELATWHDLSALRRIEKACFPKDAWPLLDLVGILTFPNIIRLKAICDGQMVGFVAGDIKRSERLAWIATIGVLPEYRGRGIGAALLRACEEKLDVPVIRLVVRQSNDTAIRLYVRFGYAMLGQWRKYYSDGEDGTVMEKRV
jgi:ribosomal protein S18 acetylase RimI-like enzyme